VITGRLSIKYRHEAIPRTGNTGPNDDKGEERPDARHLADHLDLCQSRDDRDNHAGDDGRDIGGSELRVHFADAPRQQTVAAHRKENARLGHEHDEHHRSNAGNRSCGHEISCPVLPDHGQRVGHRRVEEANRFLWRHDGHARQRLSRRAELHDGDDP
jgi:hypothetical protein